MEVKAVDLVVTPALVAAEGLVVKTVVKALALVVEAASVGIEMIEANKTHLRCKLMAFLMVPMKTQSRSALTANAGQNLSKS